MCMRASITRVNAQFSLSLSQTHLSVRAVADEDHAYDRCADAPAADVRAGAGGVRGGWKQRFAGRDEGAGHVLGKGASPSFVKTWRTRGKGK